ncbi:MAG: hypothetical protein HUK26_05535 [Duodenibacillus sp.]|nr:hypothetical protein [Duodenibacillus sp.]
MKRRLLLGALGAAGAALMTGCTDIYWEDVAYTNPPPPPPGRTPQYGEPGYVSQHARPPQPPAPPARNPGRMPQPPKVQPSKPQPPKIQAPKPQPPKIQAPKPQPLKQQPQPPKMQIRGPEPLKARPADAHALKQPENLRRSFKPGDGKR